MILATDVHYRDEFAKAVSIAFEQWSDGFPSIIHEAFLNEVEEYVPGQFYKRELPCILKVLEKSTLEAIEVIIVDGYVVLDDDGKAGLGQYLFEALDQQIPIIGVAKKGFINNKKNVVPIKRGTSDNPLFITSVGINVAEAAHKIKHMVGAYRMPDLLRILDQKTKEK